MKKFKVILAFFTLFAFQLSFSQPAKKDKKETALFNPVTHCQLRYYYYPNLQAYFDTQKRLYFYMVKGEWQTAEEIPTGYRGYSMYNQYSVFITDYDDDNIQQFINIHKKKYPYITNEKSKQLTVSTE